MSKIDNIILFKMTMINYQLYKKEISMIYFLLFPAFLKWPNNANDAVPIKAPIPTEYMKVFFSDNLK